MTDALPLIGQEPINARPEPDDERHWSVTNTIGVLDKPALVPWAVKETAERVIDRLDVIANQFEKLGRDEAVRYVKNLRWNTGGRLTAAQHGTVAHRLFDQYALTGVRPAITPDLHPDRDRMLHRDDIISLRCELDQFDAFLNQFQPEYLATEVVVFDRVYGVAGQCDAFLSIDGVPLIADYKTSTTSWDWKGNAKGPYPEVALQLSAYRYATFAAVWRARRFEPPKGRRYYLLNADEAARGVPVPVVEGGVAIYITPEQYGVYPVRCDERVHEAFLFVLEAARWQFQTSQHVIGNPMMPPHPTPVSEDIFAGLPLEG